MVDSPQLCPPTTHGCVSKEKKGPGEGFEGLRPTPVYRPGLLPLSSETVKVLVRKVSTYTEGEKRGRWSTLCPDETPTW